MSEDVKGAVLAAFRMLLRPVVRTLLRSGVTWKEAAEACKATFVEVATEDFGLHGRPTSISRVAILTGMARRDVGRIRRLLKAAVPPELGRVSNATRVLTGWHLDPEFLDDAGRPRELTFTGEGATFTALARRYAGDIAPVTMLKELSRVGALERTPDGGLRVLKRYYMPLALDPAMALQAGSVMEDLGAAVHYNLARREGQPTRFVGRATNTEVRAGAAADFRAYLEQEGQVFLERADAWLSAHEVPSEPPRRHRTIRLGVGVFQIQDE
jgi:hypothetical protein